MTTDVIPLSPRSRLESRPTERGDSILVDDIGAVSSMLVDLLGLSRREGSDGPNNDNCLLCFRLQVAFPWGVAQLAERPAVNRLQALVNSDIRTISH